MNLNLTFFRPKPRSGYAAVGLLLSLSLLATDPVTATDAERRGGGGGDGDDQLTLRLDDAVGKPGGQVAVVLRTYAARPIRQGRLGVKTGPRRLTQFASFGSEGLSADAAAAGPFVRLLSATVFSVAGDAVTSAGWSAGLDGQPTQVDFRSATGSINAADGPLLVLKYRLSTAVQPGEIYDIGFDSALTSLVDAQGQPILIEQRPAVLTIRAASDPIAVEAEGDEVAPGEVATVGLHTFEPIALAGGQMMLLYDASVVTGTPTVRIDPRFGKATFTVKTPRPGKIVVRFTSADKSLNKVPGLLVAVGLTTRASTPVGLSTALALDPVGSYLLDGKGRRLKLKIEAGDLSFR